MFECWKFKTQFSFDNKINKPSLQDITFLNLFIITSTSRTQFLAKMTTQRILCSENTKPKLSANITWRYILFTSTYLEKTVQNPI